MLGTKWPWTTGLPRWPARMSNGKPWPRLTVITPSYNQGKFIEETILSVLRQGYPNLEYIIIDGGSTDNTVEILRKHEHALAYWVSERDQGQSSALNKGLRRATGEIIGWLNSDDMYTEGCFRHVVDAFAASPDAVLVHGNRILLDADSHVSGWATLPSFDPQTTGFIVCSETAFWRRSVGALFSAELRFAMDLEFFSRLYQTGRFVKLDAFLGYFRCYRGNKSSSLLEICRRESELEWKKIFGEGHEGWRNRPRVTRTASLAALVRHPRTIALPYLYRRLVLRKRGL
jgi:glycosyltransferase involved in cell wall biosynthesis